MSKRRTREEKISPNWPFVRKKDQNKEKHSFNQILGYDIKYIYQDLIKTTIITIVILVLMYLVKIYLVKYI